MNNENEKDLVGELGYGLADKPEDPFMGFLHQIIRVAVKVLAVLMVAVIVWGIGDVIYVLYQRLMEPPFLLLSISDILATFGAFLAVLIAIEIFINITLYLEKDVIPVKIVVATALMAISRKVIIFDFEKVTPPFVLATAAVVLALGITYWLITKKT
ncbi:MAG: phosphate-starvation-inducible PsiE family protein [Candidatus Polarisedimenticolaceae bacterium]|nr:phosphate-starvation-inducible PsiE family protein [Candidatus Polarisedimenticolaceae bacterium]